MIMVLQHFGQPILIARTLMINKTAAGRTEDTYAYKNRDGFMKHDYLI